MLCLSQDGVMVLSATHRYKKKYVTTLLYKPIRAGASPTPHAGHETPLCLHMLGHRTV